LGDPHFGYISKSSKETLVQCLVINFLLFDFGDGALVAIIPKRININGNKLLGKSQNNGKFG